MRDWEDAVLAALWVLSAIGAASVVAMIARCWA